MADRLAIAGWLAELISLLEMAECSHRDLSATNLLVDRRRGDLHLIDWDALFHPSLTFQPNTTLGTLGYTAPWAMQDASTSWCPGADRFALAICLAEVLTIAPGMALRGDGSLFDQAEVGRDAPAFQRVLAALKAVSPKAGDLFCAAWFAGSFTDCPSPAEWLAALVRESAPYELATPSAPHLQGAASAATRYQRLGRLVTSLRLALQRGDLVAIEAAIDQEPVLAKLLSADERARLAELRQRGETLAVVRWSLRTGDDEVIARASAAPALPTDGLRPSERWAIDQVARRRTALDELEGAVLTGDDDAIGALWRQAALLGAQVPAHLRASVRAARLRTLRRRPPSSPAGQLVVAMSAEGSGRSSGAWPSL
jgi:hypothetical protein